MFWVYVAGDELSPVTHNFRQSFFAITVDRCHLGQFNDALAGFPRYSSFSPGRPELSCPLADQLTLQRPPLPLRRARHSDPQHCSSSLLRESVERANSNVLLDEFNEPARKHVAVEEPKERKHFRCPHLLTPAAFRSRGAWRSNAQSQDPEAGDVARLPDVRHHDKRP